VNSVAEYVATIIDYFPNHRWVFRGQPEDDYELKPKGFRNEFLLPPNEDLLRFERWRDQAIAFGTTFPGNYLEQLVHAQHFGLATRLLDWTANAVIALYFASEYRFVKGEDSGRKNGAVYAYKWSESDEVNDAVDSEKINSRYDVLALDEGGVRFYRPRLVNRRILAQDGCFTLHPDSSAMATTLLNEVTVKSAAKGTVFKMSVPGERKMDLQYQLRAIGIQARTVFPDLEGLSRSTNWQTNWTINHSM